MRAFFGPFAAIGSSPRAYDTVYRTVRKLRHMCGGILNVFFDRTESAREKSGNSQNVAHLPRNIYVLNLNSIKLLVRPVYQFPYEDKVRTCTVYVEEREGTEGGNGGCSGKNGNS